MIRYCVNCLLPETKPDLTFDDAGVCDACQNYHNRKQVNWGQRKKELLSILDRYRSKNGENWDCIIPVSGGKDSTYQVIKMLEYGMNPLCVTSTTCDVSEVGKKNIQNIKELGVDYIEASPNPKVRRKLNRIGLLEVGDISWPEHVGIFTIPIQVAVNYRIPLIIWGENSQNEYGGPELAKEERVLNRRWLEEFGGLLGMRVTDLDLYNIQKKDLLLYTYPDDAALSDVGVTGIFLGYFEPWDGYRNSLVAQAYGFNCNNGQLVEGSIVNYENLDNHQTGIHDYFKFLKFGFSRATDIASLHIRRGLLSREQGLELVKKYDGRFPSKLIFPHFTGHIFFRFYAAHSSATGVL
ncbi:N-acetyl sugar amidotransferase [Candidiatus Paracoxiella cheracis]|uniref:N-acetyl sugar amidotransferase n=1 Tax=Candidiatus Paracoxiella cheracis TaxID=3405120 RepID=UPI003BF60B7E